MKMNRLRFRQGGVNSTESEIQLALARADRERLAAQDEEDRKRRTGILQEVATRHGFVPRRLNDQLRRTGGLADASEQYHIPGA